MSLILDALKKLEQEKTIRRGKPKDLAPAILQETRRVPRFRWRPTVLIVVTVVCTSALTLAVTKFIWSPESKRADSAVPSAERAAPIRDLQAATPSPPQALPSPAPTQPPPAALPVSKPAPASAPHPPVPANEPAPAAVSVPDLKVTGIAWQEEQEGRRAVVNGALVREGGIVAGARVKEILPDRVRFSAGGRIFDITNTTPFR